MAYWSWNFKPHGVANFNLITLKNGNIQTTKYYELLKNAISSNLTSLDNDIEGGQGIKNKTYFNITSSQRDQQVPVG